MDCRKWTDRRTSRKKDGNRWDYFENIDIRRATIFVHLCSSFCFSSFSCSLYLLLFRFLILSRFSLSFCFPILLISLFLFLCLVLFLPSFTYTFFWSGYRLLLSRWMFEPRHNILSNVRTNVQKYVVTSLEYSRENKRPVPGPLFAELSIFFSFSPHLSLYSDHS